MAEGDSFEGFLVGLRGGSPEAAREVFQRYSCRLIGLARGRLHAGLRQKVDPEDLVQSAYKSFFIRFADGQFQIQDWESLWSLLTVITLRKCGHETQYFRAARHDVSREIRPANFEDSALASWQAIDRAPTPDEAVVVTETVDQVMRQLSEREQQIVMLSLQGYEVAEISQQVARTERTVRRALERVREILQSMRDAA